MYPYINTEVKEKMTLTDLGGNNLVLGTIIVVYTTEISTYPYVSLNFPLGYPNFSLWVQETREDSEEDGYKDMKFKKQPPEIELLYDVLKCIHICYYSSPKGFHGVYWYLLVKKVT